MANNDRVLGKLPAKSNPKALMFANYVKAEVIKTVPRTFNFWRTRARFPLRTFGNTEVGDCTRASQAAACMRMERIETSQTPKITDDEIKRVYFDMTARLYGGGDTGAYEEDALSEWRKPDLTFKDTKGRTLTIDAFTRINQANLDELKSAIWSTAGHGIKVCFNLPKAWSDPSVKVWDIPVGQALVGEYVPGSWGGHSMYAFAYDQNGVWVAHTWGIPPMLVTWSAVSAYSDEAHWVMDSIDGWRKSKLAKNFQLSKLKSDVNDVSAQKIK